MLLSLKELAVVLAIALATFACARPIALRFTAAADFGRRRNVWLLLTGAGFLSPNFWVFALIAMPIMIWAATKDSTPAAIYLLLLHVIPPTVSPPLPLPGLSSLFNVNNYLLLALFIMLPTTIRVLRSKSAARIRGLDRMDVLLLSYGVLTSALYIHQQTPAGGLFPSTFTDDLRRGVLFLFGVFIPYFAISRSACSRRALLDTMATFCLACGMMAAIAIFEATRHWLLYGDIADRWGHAVLTPYVLRGTSLRAMASTGHSLALGFLLVVAVGFWLSLQGYVKSVASRWAASGLLLFGLLAAYSRGPWIGAVFLYFTFATLRPRPISGLLRAAGVGLIVVAIVSLTPLRDKVVSVLPFLGGRVDYANVIYREQLFDRAWQIIRGSPWLGDQSALLKMQDLRQGQGIIDLVNTYLQVLLANGFVGLTLFLGFILIGVSRAWHQSRAVMRIDPDLGTLGISLVACMLAAMLMLYGGSFGTGPERIFYTLAALTAAYAQVVRVRQGARVPYTAVGAEQRSRAR